MGTLLIPGAEHIAPSLAGGEITSTAPPRVVWHTTQNPSGDPRQWANVIATLRAKSAEPNVLYDPSTDRLGQFIPLNLSGRALKNDGSSRTNRVGLVCIQIEVIAYAEKPFTKDWKPGPNFRALMAAIRSWGIADVWPAGPPPVFIASPPHNVPENARSRAVWLTKGGHYSHSQIPGNDHGDCGGISTVELFAAGKPTTPTPKPPEDNMANWTEEQLRKFNREEQEKYAKRFWVDPTGTGTALIKKVEALGNGLVAIGAQLTAEDKADDAALNVAVAELKAAIAAEVPAPPKA